MSLKRNFTHSFVALAVIAASMNPAMTSAGQFQAATSEDPAAETTGDHQADDANHADGQMDDKVLTLPQYTGASNGDLAVAVTAVHYAFEKDDYLPKDPNWAQITLRVENVSGEVISLEAAKSKQTSGVVLDSAGTVVQLAEPPDVGTQMAKTGGIAVAGHMAGMLIFPPLAILGGIGALLGMNNSQKKWKRQMETIEASALRTGLLPSDGVAEGKIYIPATTEQAELVIFYKKRDALQSLAIPVSGYREYEAPKKKKRFGIF